jgi:hypothetical protein
MPTTAQLDPHPYDAPNEPGLDEAMVCRACGRPFPVRIGTTFDVCDPCDSERDD